MANRYNINDDLNFTQYNQVLASLKKDIMKELNVASIAKVIGFEEDQVYVQLLPTLVGAKQETTYVYNLSKQNLKKDDYVVVIFLNKDSRLLIKRILNGQSETVIQTDNERHSTNFGIVVSKI